MYVCVCACVYAQQSEHFPFLGISNNSSAISDMRCRTTFYTSLGRLLLVDLGEDEEKFYQFMMPLTGGSHCALCLCFSLSSLCFCLSDLNVFLPVRPVCVSACQTLVCFCLSDIVCSCLSGLCVCFCRT